MQVLVVDVGGNHVKFLVTGQETPRKFDSGPSMTAEEMVSGVLKAANDFKHEAVSIGYPSLRPVVPPHAVVAMEVPPDTAIDMHLKEPHADLERLTYPLKRTRLTDFYVPLA